MQNLLFELLCVFRKTKKHWSLYELKGYDTVLTYSPLTERLNILT